MEHHSYYEFHNEQHFWETNAYFLKDAAPHQPKMFLITLHHFTDIRLNTLPRDHHEKKVNQRMRSKLTLHKSSFKMLTFSNLVIFSPCVFLASYWIKNQIKLTSSIKLYTKTFFSAPRVMHKRPIKTCVSLIV